jgi:hypothetical protein
MNSPILQGGLFDRPDVLDRMVENPNAKKARDYQMLWEATVKAATVPGADRLVSAGQIRDQLPEDHGIIDKHFGTFTSGLVRRKWLRATGDVTMNGNVKQRNAMRLCKVYYLTTFEPPKWLWNKKR